MELNTEALAQLTDEELATSFSDEELSSLAQGAFQKAADVKQTNPILYYQPASAECRKIHQSTAKEVFSTGGNRCAVAGTMVLTPSGLVPIEQLGPGDGVFRKGNNPVPVTATYKSESPEDIFRLTTKRGYQTSGSADHPVYVCSPKEPGWHNGTHPDVPTAKWQVLSQVKPGDFVCMAFTGPFPAQCDISEDDAYFLGLMTGDGYWSGKKFGVMTFTENDEDEDLLTFIEVYLKKHEVRTRRSHRKQGNGTDISWCNLRFKGYVIDELGADCVLGYQRTVPRTVLAGTKAVVAAFIRGLFDTDGCATTKPSAVLVNRAEKLCRQVHVLLLRFGITSSLHFIEARPEQKRPNPIYRLEITGSNLGRFREFIGFALARKQSRLPERRTLNSRFGHYYPRQWDRIASVEVTEKGYVYGLTLASEAREYLADGFLHHNSGKSETSLAELVIQMTGIIPECMEDDYPREKIRPPIRARISCVAGKWDDVLKMKLDPAKWSGESLGHWGWIPPRFLRNGKFEDSWSEKHRTLNLLNGSSVQIMSYEQDVEKFSGHSIHLSLHDEGPREAIYRENKLRTMDVRGRLMTAMTPPDDEAASWDAAWMYDQLYEKGQPGPSKDPDIDSFTLYTTDNRTLDPDEIKRTNKNLTPLQRDVREKGKFLHLTGLIYPIYSGGREESWCFGCNKPMPMKPFAGTRVCLECESADVTNFCHLIEPFEQAYGWPIVNFFDPHPRKDNMLIWVAISPTDDYYQVAEMSEDKEPEDLRVCIEELENRLGMYTMDRRMDPNMGASAAHQAGKRGVSVQKEFADCGLRFRLADDNFQVGKNRLTKLLRPDRRTMRPRLHIFSTCKKTDFQLRHFAWDEWARYRTSEKDPKPTPKGKNDDFPTLLRYFANQDYSYRAMSSTATPMKRAGRRGAY